jgi:hypothetical protein
VTTGSSLDCRGVESIGTQNLKEASPDHGSILPEIVRIANSDQVDVRGLCPWWLLRDTGVTPYIFKLPQGRDEARFETLQEQRLLYRLALGQPNRGDFINLLTASRSETVPVLRKNALNLSAFSRSRPLRNRALTLDLVAALALQDCPRSSLI